MERGYAYYKAVFEEIPKPFAYVDLDLLDANAAQILSAAGPKRIRLATKSVRCVELIRRILDKDPQFRGLMTFSPYESVYLSKQGMDDILLGYPVWDSAALEMIAGQLREGKRITLMVDSAEHVEHVAETARRSGITFPLCLDMDMSLALPGLHFGVQRSPIRTVAGAEAVVRAIAASDGVYLDGVMGYEAQVAGVGDNYPRMRTRNSIVRALKKQSVKMIAEKRAAIVSRIQEMTGRPLRFVNGGGTGSLHTTSLEQAVTEVTAGSGFFNPGLFDHYRDFRYEPAAGFAVEIVRKPGKHLYTCLGGGYTASGSAGKDKLPRPYLPEGAALLSMEGAGEVQTPVFYRGNESLGLGDPVFFRHAKAGELCERFNGLYVVADGRVQGQYLTYRGDGQCFL